MLKNMIYCDVQPPKPKPTSQQEIPIPVVIESATYQQDYLPTFREKTIYIRGRGEDNFRQLCAPLFELIQEYRNLRF